MDQCSYCKQYIFENEDNIEICSNCKIPKNVFNTNTKQIKQTNKCNNCNSEDLIIDNTTGNTTCTKCGVIQNNSVISEEAEWNNYSSDLEAGKDNSRVSWTDTSNPYSKLGTYIAKSKYNFNVVTTSDGKKIRFNLIKTQQIVSANSKEKSFYDVIKLFNGICRGCEIPMAASDRAKNIWHQITKTNRIFRGGTRLGLLACCMFYACKQLNVPLTRENIASEFRTSIDNIVKSEPIFKSIISDSPFSDILEIKTNYNNKLTKIINILGLPYKYNLTKCWEVYKKCEEELSEINEQSAYGGVVCYVVTVLQGLKKPTKKDIAAAAGISGPTVNNTLKIIIAEINH